MQLGFHHSCAGVARVKIIEKSTHLGVKKREVLSKRFICVHDIHDLVAGVIERNLYCIVGS